MTATILLVEDDTVLRFGLSELFTREGYAVIQAASAREAREKLTETTELIVLDVSLPASVPPLCLDTKAMHSFVTQQMLRDFPGGSVAKT